MTGVGDDRQRYRLKRRVVIGIEVACMLAVGVLRFFLHDWEVGFAATWVTLIALTWALLSR